MPLSQRTDWKAIKKERINRIELGRREELVITVRQTQNIETGEFYGNWDMIIKLPKLFGEARQKQEADVLNEIETNRMFEVFRNHHPGLGGRMLRVKSYKQFCLLKDDFELATGVSARVLPLPQAFLDLVGPEFTVRLDMALGAGAGAYIIGGLTFNLKWHLGQVGFKYLNMATFEGQKEEREEGLAWLLPVSSAPSQQHVVAELQEMADHVGYAFRSEL